MQIKLLILYNKIGAYLQSIGIACYMTTHTMIW